MNALLYIQLAEASNAMVDFWNFPDKECEAKCSDHRYSVWKQRTAILMGVPGFKADILKHVTISCLYSLIYILWKWILKVLKAMEKIRNIYVKDLE